MDADIEMVDKQRRATRFKRRNQIDDDDVVAADELLDDRMSGVESVMHRQNTCFAVALVALLMSLSVLLVGKVYMVPTEIEVAGELHEIEAGDISMTSNEIHGGGAHASDQAIDKARSKAFGASDWLHNKGKVPSPLNPDDTSNSNFNDYIPGFPGNGVVPSRGKDDIQRPSGFGSGTTLEDRTRAYSFDREKWLNSIVTINDGPLFEVVRTLSHDRGAFIEGLAYARGQLYESTGLNGKSSIRKLNPFTGEVIESFPLNDEYFGEGLTVVLGKAIQLTWKHQVGFIYNVGDLSKAPRTFQFTSTRNEGWGLAYSHELKEIAMSDGSDYIHFWDPRNLTETRRIQVKRQNGADSSNINELEFFHGRLLANVWMQDVIISINPMTGEVDKEYGEIMCSCCAVSSGTCHLTLTCLLLQISRLCIQRPTEGRIGLMYSTESRSRREKTCFTLPARIGTGCI